MKMIGLIGGMSWESTALYYRIINEQVKQQLGGLHSARSLMYSVDFQQIEKLQVAGEWQQAGEIWPKPPVAGEGRGGFHCAVHQHHAQSRRSDHHGHPHSAAAYR